MMVDNDFVPRYILDDLSDPTTLISINIGWEIVDYADDVIEIFNEKYGSLKFFKSSLEFELIRGLLCNHALSIRNFYKTNLVKLWKKGLFHIYFSKEDSISHRYHHFFETLIRYSGRDLSPYEMFRNLLNSNVAIIGVGGLGSNIAMLLASHGIRNITLIDGDRIDESNLTRQLFYKFKDKGKYKVDILKKSILANNKNIKVECVKEFISSYNMAFNLLDGYDFVLLCADEPRMKIKAWIGKACFERDIPLLIMANQWIGPILKKNRSPCYACLGRYHLSKMPNKNILNHLDLNNIPPRASFGPIPFIVAGYLSSIVILYLTGIDRETFLNKRLEFSLFGVGVEEIVTKYTDCLICK